MSGCYGDNAEDKYYENKLLQHLDDDWLTCPYCGGEVEHEGQYCTSCEED